MIERAHDDADCTDNVSVSSAEIGPHDPASGGAAKHGHPSVAHRTKAAQNPNPDPNRPPNPHPNLPPSPPRRRPMDLPPLRIDRKGYARVWLSGAWRRVGHQSDPMHRQRYEELVGQWLAGGRYLPPPQDERLQADRVMSVTELGDAHLAHAEAHYLKAGRPTSTVAKIQVALDALEQSGLGSTAAIEFSAPHLAAFKRWAADPRKHPQQWGRNTINEFLSIIRRMFAWGGEVGLVPAMQHLELKAVAGLRKGRGVAPGIPAPREGERVQPVSQTQIDAVIKHTTPMIATMIRLQLATGMRPGEVVAMRGQDITKPKAAEGEAPVWIYTVDEEVAKMAHLDRARTVILPPAAVAIVQQWGTPRGYLFPGEPKTGTGPGVSEILKVESYRVAIRRAAAKAGVAAFAPNRLRHNFLSRVAETLSPQIAQELAGHSDVTTTMRYIHTPPKSLIDAARRI